ncbi:pseudouridine synthase [Leeuwenhoekiella blandensis]|uniref:Pseudouridine synthase n=1 Tax=Leeuwenhoekiella blandensis (strain CECT 7118 / CCUG 51940 / KCTC 22103 / MED217) TaxID=398720 RepID=A3XP36_LEEBM|nr:pseudouridine synthase [Leeuwenhoekiella blandensis]EAQ48684.1 RNA pseudouridine synthase family protein [Leeuwenhoekiella blandensis MED217]
MATHQHYLLFKPYGYLSQLSSNDLHQKRKKKFLAELYSWPDGIMPIGRLDEKSEGLLLMTTDGKLSDHINRSGIEKEYYALVDGIPTEAQLEQLSQGIEIGINGKKYRTKPCGVKILETSPALPDRGKKIRDARHGPTTWLSITIIEGKFRQVRKMTSAIDCPTLRLVRIRIGSLKLKAIQPGEVLVWDGEV